jgi:hypothetical protein
LVSSHLDICWSPSFPGIDRRAIESTYGTVQRIRYLCQQWNIGVEVVIQVPLAPRLSEGCQASCPMFAIGPLATELGAPSRNDGRTPIQERVEEIGAMSVNRRSNVWDTEAEHLCSHHQINPWLICQALKGRSKLARMTEFGNQAGKLPTLSRRRTDDCPLRCGIVSTPLGYLL